MNATEYDIIKRWMEKEFDTNESTYTQDADGVDVDLLTINAAVHFELMENDEMPDDVAERVGELALEVGLTYEFGEALGSMVCDL